MSLMKDIFGVICMLLVICAGAAGELGLIMFFTAKPPDWWRVLLMFVVVLFEIASVGWVGAKIYLRFWNL